LEPPCPLLLYLAPIALSPAVTQAQAQPPTSPAPLTLAVKLLSRDGVPTTGLRPQDFTVKIDKLPQPVVSVTPPSATPAEVVLIVDSINANVGSTAVERKQIEDFLRRNNGHLANPVSLALITEVSFSLQHAPSRDGNALAAALEHAESSLRPIDRSTGFNGAADRFEKSVRGLKQIIDAESKRPGRKILVWISPGWPLLSNPDPEYTEKTQKGYFDVMVSLTNSMQKGNIVLNHVDPLGATTAGSLYLTAYLDFTKGVPSPKKMRIGNLSLQALSLLSGGQVLNGSNDVASLIDTAANTADTYTLTLTPPPAQHPDQYRAIAVSVDKPGLTPHTSTGFYEQQ
jgi:VWFA-related protein